MFDDKLFNILENNGFYLDEDILLDYQDCYTFLEKSGISIKIDDSDSYQLLKLSPNSFNKIFKNYELGYGASLFCKNKEELVKNSTMLSGWNTNIEKVKRYFSIYNVTEDNLYGSIDFCKQVKKYSIEKITEIIDSSKNIQLMIFNGIGLYSEPYTAWYFMQNKTVVKLSYIPFVVTTGSGRTRGDYTIVLKPKRR